MTYYNGMTIEEIADAQREEIGHSRFNEEHYCHCQSCNEDHLDFMQELEAEARLDAMIEASEVIED